MTKLGFLGAMNRDVVVQQPAARLLPSIYPDAEPLVETPVSDAVAQRGAAALANLGAATHLGGSAFNVARVVALLNADAVLDLAFFGIAGSVNGTQPHLEALAEWSVLVDTVAVSTLPPATCLAMVEPSGRTLLTALGANAGIATWLREHRQTLISAIAQCDIVHVTSFLDPAAPGLIAGLVQNARAMNPALRVSLDPGMAWLAPGGDGLEALMRETTILHLNAEEFALSGGPDAVSDIGRKLASDWLVVARTHAGATLYRDGDQQSFSAHPPDTGFRVVDANGAGDTFCGGFLWAHARGNSEPLGAAELGFAMARQKVGRNGPLTRESVDAAISNIEGW